MIAYLQKRRKFLVIVLGITVFAFVGAGFVGWGSYSYGSKSGAVATVGEEKITVLQYSQAYSSLYNMYSQFYENGIDQSMDNQLKQAALEGLINEALLVNYAKELGLRVSEKEVQDRIMAIDAFKKDGVFNKEIYTKSIRNTNQEIKDFESGLANRLLIEKLVGFMALPVTQNEMETIAASYFMRDKLVVDLIDAPKSVFVTTKELESHYEANKQNYMAEPTYDVSYIKVGIAGFDATEDEAREYYNKNRGEFLSANGELVSFDDSKGLAIKAAKMNKARKEALKQKVAWRDNKIEPTTKNGLSFTNKTLPIEVMSILESSQSKKVSDPIAVEDGYVVARIDNRYEAKPKSFNDVRALVERDLKAKKIAMEFEATATKRLESFKGKDIGFISRDEPTKLVMLSYEEAQNVLEHIFKSSDERGIVYLGNKALLYRVVAQQLVDSAKLKEQEKMIENGVAQMKFAQIQQNLIEELSRKYKIVIY